MQLFLKPFVNDLKDLHYNGITFTPSRQIDGITIKVHTLLSPIDSVARPVVQYISQYNGKFGCSLCFNKGERMRVGKGHARVFCGGIGIKRSKKKHEKHVEKAITEKRRVFGVKGFSLTMFIPLFNIIYSFPPEYIHCVLLGVCKTFATMWFDSKNFQKPWYIGTRVNLYDQKLKKIMPCHEISRTTDSIENFGLWKASQWKHHLLYYSLVCLKDILSLRYYKHWLLLVFSIYTILKDRFSIQEFRSAKRALQQFIEDTETLYGKEYMKYNIHLLLYIPDSVKQFGALWAWSAFPFEHYNGILTTMFHNSQSVPQQICKSYLRLQNIKNSTIFLQQNCSVSRKSLFNKMFGDSNIDKYLHFGLLKICGCAQQVELSVIE
ncbi:uncharacterized protein LOC105207063 isoform X1 [Solenopsis invicta]|uniref:uncharacterized protein LOC105207063 isoform X1 n=1 Tax=Solenopsis invicta TaxID=13686 RepID=UPI00193E2F52|nr:uncharacterized protein LOC105207063 isoform X1 [Solenopsis invicta]XP_039311946.1 uncharacterized protein LOC105207063 isoform X1 [Solenopsis invicta]